MHAKMSTKHNDKLTLVVIGVVCALLLSNSILGGIRVTKSIRIIPIQLASAKKKNLSDSGQATSNDVGTDNSTNSTGVSELGNNSSGNETTAIGTTAGNNETTTQGTSEMIGGGDNTKNGCLHGTGTDDTNPCQPCDPRTTTDCDEVNPILGKIFHKGGGILRESGNTSSENGTATLTGTGKEIPQGNGTSGSQSLMGTSGQGCLGTSGKLGQPCIPCDPTKVSPGYNTTCTIRSNNGVAGITGGLLNQGGLGNGVLSGQTNQTSSGQGFKESFMQGFKAASQGRTSGELFSFLQSLESGKKIPSGFTNNLRTALNGNTAGSARALVSICNTITAGTNANCNVAPPSQVKPGAGGTAELIACGPFCGALIGWGLAKLMDLAIEKTKPDYKQLCNSIGGVWHTIQDYDDAWCELP